MTGPIILIVMGVSGAGKSTIAEELNDRLHWKFQEGDDLHPRANVDKMAHGIPLTDEDRWPWLDAIKRWIDERCDANENAMVTCSALKRIYRKRLIAGRPNVRILYLRADVPTLEEHLAQRAHHFMPPSLLDSQLHTLEEPAPDENPIIVQIEKDVGDTVGDIMVALKPLLRPT